MQVDTLIQLVNSVYHVQVGPSEEPFTPEENSAIAKFGEMLIACGGSFTDGDALTFARAADDRLYPSQFPVSAEFAIADHADAADRADVFRDTIIARLTEAKATLMAKTSANLGRNTVTI